MSDIVTYFQATIEALKEARRLYLKAEHVADLSEKRTLLLLSEGRQELFEKRRNLPTTRRVSK